MNRFDAAYAWDLGYYYAVRGIANMPRRTWLSNFRRDWKAGYRQAVLDGKWNTFI